MVTNMNTEPATPYGVVWQEKTGHTGQQGFNSKEKLDAKIAKLQADPKVAQIVKKWGV